MVTVKYPDQSCVTLLTCDQKKAGGFLSLCERIPRKSTVMIEISLLLFNSNLGGDFNERPVGSISDFNVAKKMVSEGTRVTRRLPLTSKTECGSCH